MLDIDADPWICIGVCCSIGVKAMVYSWITGMDMSAEALANNADELAARIDSFDHEKMSSMREYLLATYWDDASGEYMLRPGVMLRPEHWDAVVLSAYQALETRPVMVGSKPPMESGKTALNFYKDLLPTLSPGMKAMYYMRTLCSLNRCHDKSEVDVLMKAVRGPE